MLSRPAAVVALSAAVAVDVGVVLLHPDVDWYVGLSGIVYGLIAGGAVLELRREPRLATLVLVGLGIKLLVDARYGTPASTEAFVGGSVLAEAHLYGALGGAVAAGLIVGNRVRAADAASKRRRPRGGG